MKIPPSRNLKYFNLLFLGLIIQSFNPVLSKSISSKNSLTTTFEKSYFKENLKSNSLINSQFKKQISFENLDLALNNIRTKNIAFLKFTILKIICKVKLKINLEDFLNLFY